MSHVVDLVATGVPAGSDPRHHLCHASRPRPRAQGNYPRRAPIVRVKMTRPDVRWLLFSSGFPRTRVYRTNPLAYAMFSTKGLVFSERSFLLYTNENVNPSRRSVRTGRNLSRPLKTFSGNK